jgi:hypothetical protein
MMTGKRPSANSRTANGRSGGEAGLASPVKLEER